MTAARDPQAEQGHAEWLGWAEAQGYHATGTEYDLTEMAAAFKAGMEAERDLAAAQPAEPARYALVEQMGHRATVGTVRETTFLGKLMLEVTDLRTGRTSLAAPESLYGLTWLTEDDARTRARPWTATAITTGSNPWREDSPDDEDVADPHRDLDAGENGGAMTDADFYDRTAGAGE